jgi:hypothetical protein
MRFISRFLLFLRALWALPQSGALELEHRSNHASRTLRIVISVTSPI